MRQSLRRLAEPAAVVAVLIVDRLAKLWAMEYLRPRFELPLLPFFSLAYVENTGVAFGLFFGKNLPMIFVSAALIAGLLWWLWRIPPSERLTRAAVLLILSGALGNLYDRLAYGYVVDFLYLHHWPVFNVADSCITIGACLLALDLGKKT